MSVNIDPAVKRRPSTRIRLPKDDRSEVICHCRGVTRGEILNVIEAEPKRRAVLEEIMRITSAGTGCTACQCKIERMIQGLPACGQSRFALCKECRCCRAICQCKKSSAGSDGN